LDDREQQRFETLVLPHMDAAHNLARWLVRGRDAAPDLAQEAMLRAFRRENQVPCMTVHDELVYPINAKAAPIYVPIMYDLMLEPPPWAGGLPLAGEHKIMRRYGIGTPQTAIVNTP